MADHAHYICDFRRRGDAADFALGGDGGGHFVFVGFEDGGLVQTDGGGVDVHVCEDDVGVRDAAGETEVGWEGERDVEEDVVHVAVAGPELAVEVVVFVVAVGAVEVDEVAAEEAGHEADAAVGGEVGGAVGGHGLLEGHALHGVALLECFFCGWEICQDLPMLAQ